MVQFIRKYQIQSKQKSNSEKNWNCSECDSFQLNCLVIYIDEKWSLP